MAKSSTCGEIKETYKTSAKCCGSPSKESGFQIVPSPEGKFLNGPTNPCHGKKPVQGFENTNCTAWDAIAGAFDDNIVLVKEQSGSNVTKGYTGTIDATGEGRLPITTSYMEAGLCPVNVHWHFGAEHLSVGEFDEHGTGPDDMELPAYDEYGSDAQGAIRLGFRCHHYDKKDARFTTEYAWKHCVDMHVGETYEVHWPHSAMGACGTPNQYQTPFYDGVFCHLEKLKGLDYTQEQIGVQAQVFTIINDEDYFYPDLMRGWIVDGSFGRDVTKYTGSTTGTSRNNQICSKYAAITWQVDRKCHLISASSFDKMCADMKNQRDDMSGDLHAHGARTLVAPHLTANNHQRRL